MKIQNAFCYFQTNRLILREQPENDHREQILRQNFGQRETYCLFHPLLQSTKTRRNGKKPSFPADIVHQTESKPQKNPVLIREFAGQFQQLIFPSADKR